MGDIAGSFVPTFIELMLFGNLPIEDEIGNPPTKEQIDNQHVVPCPSIDLRGVIHEIQSFFVLYFSALTLISISYRCTRAGAYLEASESAD